MICFFIIIINIIISIPFKLSQKCLIFALISAGFLILSPKFFYFLLLIIKIFVRVITFFTTNVTLSFLWLMAIIIVIIIIVNIIAFIILISLIILPKLTICKKLNIGSIVIIVCYNKRLKFKRKFFKDCYKSKQCKFQVRDSMACLLSNGNKLIFVHITKI